MFLLLPVLRLTQFLIWGSKKVRATKRTDITHFHFHFKLRVSKYLYESHPSTHQAASNWFNSLVVVTRYNKGN